ncbi:MULTISPECIES: ROK family protein [Mesorhizobium]|uniref:ROK family protein n=3 Tax=Mesorhizobium TaxID=68287 RepID=A0ABU5AKP5_9HYPH|nr:MULTISPECIES: ROK family protein [Mesorhizobium]MDX8537868.1 ROK family protein [Mesorhizobium abyssinicae]RUW26710.1 ROK family transcriptional regulator [Mesorhizobium sp. M4B.F.Ca.ET.013.02.1.1]RUW71980.1 ROK family transcriptional regulator [Mesorhizobium sp. M4B.F.Ca.ET.049.02.1.2]RVD30672.1 ROK family transcriptional regulator [Mesorhizobium sp. M4B.F.Ca.ET.017.02.2.1]RVD46003.1 ROK family transcriptional regulator [Mesorhizobium sp. M4B.F.Ca.ET.019.03.1.1]
MSVGIRHDDLRRRNRAMVISAVRRAGQPSRTEIAATTGLSHSTISAISSDLIQEGILTESKPNEAVSLKRGRPQVGLALNPEATAVMTVVLSLNFLSVAVIDYAGQVIAEEQRRLDTAIMPRDELIGECVAIVRRRFEDPDLDVRGVARIAMGIQGITDTHARAMLWSPITPQTDIAFADILEAEFGVPATMENDCNMMAVALQWRDPERYRDDFIAILLSHGIGMGLVLKGELFTGTHSSGGEFGHMIHRPGGALCRCGRRGCVEAYAGNYAIWRNAKQMGEDAEPVDVSDADMRSLAARARAGDGPERQAYRKAGEALGFGLGSLFALIDPAPVAMVGVSAAAFDLIEPALREAIAQTAGGQHSKSISFDTEPNELPLIREGCAMRALTFVDQEIFAPGVQVKGGATGKNVA